MNQRQLPTHVLRAHHTLPSADLSCSPGAAPGVVALQEDPGCLTPGLCLLQAPAILAAQLRQIHDGN